MPGRHSAIRLLARAAARAPSAQLRQELVRAVFESEPNVVLEVVGPAFNRVPGLATMPFDLEPGDELEFHDLAGLFGSSSLNHGLVGMTIRQVAYVFGLARRMGACSAIEVGRWRGGTTVTLAAALGRGGKVWSIDLGEKEVRHHGGVAGGLDAQTSDFLERFGYDVELLVGDSRTIEVETGEVDIVLIDGDHTYEGVKNDFERFGRRVRVGGAVLFDDAFDEALFRTHVDTVGRVVSEAVEEGSFELRNSVDRLAHLERVQ